MLDFIEVNELEKRYDDYQKRLKSEKISFLGLKFNRFKFDGIYVVLLLIICIGLGTISWILKDKDQDYKIIQANNKISLPVENIKKIEKTSDEIKQEIKTTLSLNDINVRRSEDSVNFNTKKQPTLQPNQQIYTPQYEILQPHSTSGYRPLPQDEIIDFGNSPNPPKTPQSQPNKRTIEPNSIVIKSSNIDTSLKSLENKFNETKNIEYSLMIAQKFYDNSDFKNAEKWAVISNEIDKNSDRSWVIFAKSKFKQGDKSSAIIALETFNKTRQSQEIDDLINKIYKGEI